MNTKNFYNLMKLYPRILLIFFFTILLLFSSALKPIVHKLDNSFLSEHLLDLYGVFVKKQDWTTAEPLLREMNYEWLKLDQNLSFLRVAHALGHVPQRDTEDALLNSLGEGFQVMEVDLWLDQDGYLRCHHGPDLPTTYVKGDCLFSTLLQYSNINNFYLILDIKSNFVATGNKIISELQGQNSAKNIIFQLYLPEHLRIFNKWSKQSPLLAGPIVTSYNSHRSLNHILSNLSRLKIRAFAFPLDRINALTITRPTDIILFTHPVHDCTSLKTAKDEKIRGIYRSSTLSCP